MTNKIFAAANTAQLLLLVFGTIAIFTSVNAQPAHAYFDISAPSQEQQSENPTDFFVKQGQFKTISIESGENGGGDCDKIGEWDKYRHICIADRNLTVGFGTTVIIQPQAVLDIPSSVVVSNHGIIKNQGIIDIHGHLFNLGTVYNYKIINNDGLVQNYWGKINNDERATINNGMYITKEGKVGLRYVGEINNKFGIIYNDGVIANYDVINNHFGRVLNSCTGSVIGSGYVNGSDVRQIECMRISVAADTNKIQQ